MNNLILAVSALSCAVFVSCSSASSTRSPAGGGAGGSVVTAQSGGSAGGSGGTTAPGGSPVTGSTTSHNTGGAGAGGTMAIGGTADGTGGTTVSTKPTGGGGATSSTGGRALTGGTESTGGVNSGGTGAGGRVTGGTGLGGVASGGTAAGGSGTGGVVMGGTGGTTAAGGAPSSRRKPRIVVLTDIGPDDVEPDDSESLVRLLAHADLFEIEAVIAGSGYNSGNYPAAWADRIGSTIDAYEKDASNLLKRSSQSGFLADENQQLLGYWPSPAYLRARKALGSPKWGTSVLGASNDTDGSKMIVKLGDEADDRPIWITVWGGANTFAQTLWRVKNDRTAEQFKAFARKFRIYTITDQDKAYGSTDYASSAHQWMRKQAGTDLLFVWDECAWLDHNSWGVSHWNDLYAPNIQGHGNLGAIYSKYRWGVEGDTPSFLHLMPNGLNDPDAPGQGGWGGFFAYAQTVDGQTSAWVNEKGSTNTTCHKYTNNTFFPAAFNNFASRMDWAKNGTGNRNPVVVVNDDDSGNVLTLKPTPGAQVTLDAAKTTDPDGDKLTFKWWAYAEAGTYTSSISMANSSSNKATVTVPADSAGKTFHVICEVTDSGTPSLTSYRRIIFQL